MNKPPYNSQPTVVAQQVFRTGKQTLLHDYFGRWYVRLENRNNDTTIQIPGNKAEEWRRLLS